MWVLSKDKSVGSSPAQARSIFVLLLYSVVVACDSGNPVAPEPPSRPDPTTFRIVLTAEPSRLEAGSGESSVITVAVTRSADNQPPADGTEAALSTNRGNFGSDQQGPITLVKLALAAGRAQATLFAGAEAGSASLLAQVGDSLANLSVQMFEPVPPTLVAVVPNLGKPEGGEQVTIEGNGFKKPLRVSFGGSAARVVDVPSERQIVIVTPPSTAPVPAGGAVAVDVVVTVRLDQPEPLAATLTGGFLYMAEEPPPLFLVAVRPDTGDPGGGDPVALEGGGFERPLRVTFGGALAQVIRVTGSEIRVETPPSAMPVGAGERLAVDVTVTNAVDDPEPRTVTLPSGFTYVNRAAQLFLTEVVPSRGGPEGGEQVRILGGGFRAPVRVEFGDQPASMAEVTSSREILALVPTPAMPVAAGETRPVAVTVTSALGQSDSASVTLANAYAYVGPAAPPVLFLTEVVPDRGGAAGGETVRLLGGGFRAPVRVELGDQPASMATVVAADEITFVVPAPAPAVAAGETRTVAVTLFNALDQGSQSAVLANAYTYEGDPLPVTPKVFSVVPNFGPNEGGTAVTITGEGFEDPVDVLIGGIVVSGVTFVSSTELTAVTPRAGQSQRNMPVDVTVRNRRTGDEGTLAGGFTYGEAILVTSIEPTTGPYEGGTTVTVRGQGFVDPVAVELAGIGQRDEEVVDATTVRFVTAGVALATCPEDGQVPQSGVKVTNLLSGNSGTGELTFVYAVTLPRIRRVSPTAGGQAGGFTVSIEGEGFEAPVQVAFVAGMNRFDADVDSVSSTLVRVTAPRLPDTAFTEVQCATDDDKEGVRYVDLAVDVEIENKETGCADTFAGSFVYTPSDPTCRANPPPPPPPPPPP